MPDTEKKTHGGRPKNPEMQYVHCHLCHRRLCAAPIGTDVYCPKCKAWTPVERVELPTQVGELFEPSDCDGSTSLA